MSELETFRKHFMSDKVKTYRDRLEYRGQNLDKAVPQAREIINRLGLHLEVVTTGTLAAYKAFEVKQKEVNNDK